MPSFNTWAPRTGVWGSQLTTYRHKQGDRPTKYAEHAGRFGAGVGSAVGWAAAYGTRRFGSWYYPSEKINVSTRTRTKYIPKRKRRNKKKVCCRRIRGKKYCSPSFCHKKRKIKYWY